MPHTDSSSLLTLWWHLSFWEEVSWARPWVLYLLGLVPVLFLLRYLFQRRRRYRLPIHYGAQTGQGKAKSGTLVWLRFVPGTLQGLALVFFLLALARPQVKEITREKYSDGIDMVLAIDVSESMLIEDFSPNRLDAATEIARKFVAQRPFDRIGLVVFAAEAVSLSPLSTDYQLLDTLLSQVSADQMPQGGTAIGSAIAVATNRLREANTRSRLIVLLSDGNNTAGNLDPLTASRLAKTFGIKIYSILIGKAGRVPMGVDDNGQPQYIDNAIDPSTLKAVARESGGKYFRAADQQVLREVFAQINTLEKAKVKTLSFVSARDLYPSFLVSGLLCLALWMASKASFMGNVLED